MTETLTVPIPEQRLFEKAASFAIPLAPVDALIRGLDPDTSETVRSLAGDTAKNVALPLLQAETAKLSSTFHSLYPRFAAIQLAVSGVLWWKLGGGSFVPAANVTRELKGVFGKQARTRLGSEAWESLCVGLSAFTRVLRGVSRAHNQGDKETLRPEKANQMMNAMTAFAMASTGMAHFFLEGPDDAQALANARVLAASAHCYAMEAAFQARVIGILRRPGKAEGRMPGESVLPDEGEWLESSLDDVREALKDLPFE